MAEPPFPTYLPMSGNRLLIVESGDRMFREYALAAMSRRASLLLLTDQELTWQAPYVTDYMRVDPRDSSGVTEAARAMHPDGILTYVERFTESVAALAVRLGLPSTEPQAVQRCRDKSALRRCLEQASISPVRYGVAEGLDDAVAVAADIGYPIVVKPRSLGGSIGVVQVDDEQELAIAFRVAAEAHAVDGTAPAYSGVLLEQFLDGPEYSIDCVTWKGVTSPLVLAEKAVGFPPYFEETGHLVPGGAGNELDDAVELVVAAHAAAGLDRLVSHSEFRLTTRGPRIIEINVRLGGDLIPYLGYLSSGVDLAGAAADIALDRTPDTSTNGSRFASVSMIYPSRDVRVRSVGLRQDRSSYPGLDRFGILVSPGAEVRLPPRGFMSRIAFAVVTGADRSECEARRRAVEDDVVLDGDNLRSS